MWVCAVKGCYLTRKYRFEGGLGMPWTIEFEVCRKHGAEGKARLKAAVAEREAGTE
jgi:hypothetical protein|tara:strand:+ start:314 stop:481 length:168 start_codon:yes stop_codon:yes gene_type:complete